PASATDSGSRPCAASAIPSGAHCHSAACDEPVYSASRTLWKDWPVSPYLSAAPVEHGHASTAGVAMVTHRGGCHCGRVRFEVIAPAVLNLSECNCSICSRAGHQHLVVPAERFRLLAGSEFLTAYSFNTHTAKHLFCKVCGVKSFYVP